MPRPSPIRPTQICARPSGEARSPLVGTERGRRGRRRGIAETVWIWMREWSVSIKRLQGHRSSPAAGEARPAACRSRSLGLSSQTGQDEKGAFAIRRGRFAIDRQPCNSRSAELQSVGSARPCSGGPARCNPSCSGWSVPFGTYDQLPLRPPAWPIGAAIVVSTYLTGFVVVHFARSSAVAARIAAALRTLRPGGRKSPAWPIAGLVALLKPFCLR